ncbi:hypothetical protein Tco_1321642, partial [Tanacetum coccineum]
ETPENPFVAPANIHTIEAFMNRLAYQGAFDKVSAFFTKNLAQPWQTMFKVSNRCLTTGHDQTKINILQNSPNIHKRIEEDYHSIKDYVPLVSVYTTRNVSVRGMLIPNAFLTAEVRETDDFKEYETVFMKVAILMNQPQSVVSTQGTNRNTPRAYRSPTISVNPLEMKKRKQTAGESSSLRRIIKKKKKPTSSIPPPGDDRKRDAIAEATLLNEESYASIFADSILNDEGADVDDTGKVGKEQNIVVKEVSNETNVEIEKTNDVAKRKNSFSYQEQIYHSRVLRENIQEVLKHYNTVVLELRIAKTNAMIKTEMPRLVKLAVDKDREVSRQKDQSLQENVDKRVPTIFDRARMEATLKDTLRLQELLELSGLDFMEQILVMRANDKPYSFSEADFKYLNKNDIEDLYYLCRSKKVDNKKIKLMNSLITFIAGNRKLSNEGKLNSTNLNISCKDKKRVMYLEEIVKFCDATLEKALNEVNIRMFETNAEMGIFREWKTNSTDDEASNP